MVVSLVARARRWLTSPWWAPRVVLTLIADARTVRDKAWIVMYFASRLRVFRSRAFSWMAPPPRRLSWKSAPTSLFVSVESGGLSPWYETSLLRVYSPVPGFEPQAGWTVVDVGANIGAFSVWAGARLGPSGRLLAIEPNPVSFDQLRHSLDELAVDATAIQAACGDTDGQVTLHFERGYTVSSSITPFEAATESSSVPMRRLDALLVGSAIRHVDILKIDVEGAEELVLRGAGAALNDIDRIVLETTQGRIGSAVRALLHERGFALVHEESKHWSIPGLELLAFERR